MAHSPEKMSYDRKKELYDRFNEPEDNYQLLREGVQGQKGSGQMDTDAILQKYAYHADELIGIADGSISERDLVDPRNPERSGQKPDVIIPLDKSARPLKDLMDALWDQFAQDGTERPAYDFLNIDRVNWFVEQGYTKEEAQTVLGPAHFDIDKVEEKDILAIRALFVEGEITEENWQEEVAKLPTTLDGKNVLIIDEVKSQGGTLAIATQLLRRAVPEATVSGHYFWSTSYTQTDNGLKADSVPVWYSAENPMGRGIGDISQSYHDALYEKEPTQENLRRKIGWSVLSAPHHELYDGEIVYKDDPLNKRLLQDFAYLSYATADGRIIRHPSLLRSDEDKLAIYQNQDLTPHEANEWRANSRAIKHNVRNTEEGREKVRRRLEAQGKDSQ